MATWVWNTMPQASSLKQAIAKIRPTSLDIFLRIRIIELSRLDVIKKIEGGIYFHGSMLNVNFANFFFFVYQVVCFCRSSMLWSFSWLGRFMVLQSPLLWLGVHVYVSMPDIVLRVPPPGTKPMTNISLLLINQTIKILLSVKFHKWYRYSYSSKAYLQ